MLTSLSDMGAAFAAFHRRFSGLFARSEPREECGKYLRGLMVEVARKNGWGRDRFESEDVAFHQRVRQGYLELATGDPDRWLVVDATLPRREIGARVWERVSELLGREARRPS